MANQFFVPFNFDPYSTELKTAAYTIPTGYYAKVKIIRSVFTSIGAGVSVATDGGFQINSTTFYHCDKMRKSDSSGSEEGWTFGVDGVVTIYNPSALWRIEALTPISTGNITAVWSDVAKDDFGTLEENAGTGVLKTFRAKQGDRLECASNNQSIIAWLEPNIPQQREFWLTEDDAITFSTGCSYEYVVELYTKIS